MDLRTAARRLKLTAEEASALKAEWAGSQRRMPKQGLPFLTPEFVADACGEMGVSQDVIEPTIAASKRVAGNEAAAAFAWYCYDRLYGAAGRDYESAEKWPSLNEALGEDASAFYLLVLISGVPKIREVNAAHGVPPQVVKDTMFDVARGMGWRKRRNGGRGFGIRVHDLAWFANFIGCELYRLGRLQFQFSHFYHHVRVFRHTSGVALAMCDKGLRFDETGLRVERNDKEARGVWTTELAVGDGKITGYPILPTGEVVARKVSLPASEWRQVIAHGDPALGMHMPGGKPLTHADCGESFRRAIEFFPKHFPERPFLGFCCESWLLDSQLEGLLPPTSNMVRFQRDVYLLPIAMDNHELFRTVFHTRTLPEDLSKAPRDTSLQRAIVERLERGESLTPRAGGCFLLPEDLNWGAEVYRRQNLSPWVG